MTTARRLALLALLAGAAALASCGSARRGVPLTGEREPPNERVALGQQLFDRMCAQCHPGGTRGLAPALNDKPLPGWLIRWQVRHGLGEMPSFSERELSDEQLDAVAEYVIWLRRQR